MNQFNHGTGYRRYMHVLTYLFLDVKEKVFLNKMIIVGTKVNSLTFGIRAYH